MVRRLLVAAVLVACIAALPALAGDEKTYGKGVTGAEIVKISDLLAKPDQYVGKTVRVEGLITDVCPRRGCWINIAGDKEFQTLKFKVEDGVIAFPLDAKGKRAQAEGVFTKLEMTPEQAVEHAKHQAEERGVAFDPAKAKDIETVVYQIQGTGAVVR